MQTTVLEAPQRISATAKYSNLPPVIRDAIMSDIGKGIDSYSDIARRHKVAPSTVARIAAKRGFPSPVGPAAKRVANIARALQRETIAHNGLMSKDIAALDADTLSKIAERAANTVHVNMAATERADQPAATIILAPDMRVIVNAFMGRPTIEPRNITYPAIEATDAT